VGDQHSHLQIEVVAQPDLLACWTVHQVLYPELLDDFPPEKHAPSKAHFIPDKMFFASIIASISAARAAWRASKFFMR